MNALTAPIAHVHRSDALWLIPLLPLVAALANGLFGRAIARRFARRGPLAVGVSGSALSLLVSAVSAYELFGLDEDARQLLQAGPSFARIGTLDAGLVLLCEPSSAALAIAAAVLSLVAFARAWSRGASAAELAAISLAASGTSLAALSDSALGVLVGAGLVAAAAVASRAGRGARASLAGIAVSGAAAALVAATAVPFWSVGGSWGIALGNEPTFTRRNPIPPAVVDAEAEDAPTTGPALVAVRVGAAASAPSAPIDPTARGFVTLVDWPGARLFLRGSLEPSAVSPVVRHEVYAGRIDIEVEPYPGAKRIHLHAVEVPPGVEVQLAPLGPTTSFRALRDQLAFVDASKQRLVRDFLDPASPSHRRVGPFAAGTFAAVLIAVAGAALSLVSPLLGAGLLARASFLVALSPSASAACAVGGAVLALACAVFGCLQRDPRRALALATVSGAGFVLIATGVGAPTLAVVHAISVAIAIEALRLVRALPVDGPRVALAARILALAVAGAPVPLLGPSFSRVEIVARAGADLAWPRLAKLVAVVAILATAAIAVLVLRATHPATQPEPAPGSEPAPAPGSPPTWLPLAALALAAAVAVTGPLLGMRGALGLGVVGLSFAGLAVLSALVAAGVARRRLEEGRALPDRRPLEALGSAVACTIRRLGEAVAWIDRAIVDRPGHVLGERFAPRPADTSHTAPPTVPR